MSFCPRLPWLMDSSGLDVQPVGGRPSLGPCRTPIWLAYKTCQRVHFDLILFLLLTPVSALAITFAFLYLHRQDMNAGKVKAAKWKEAAEVERFEKAFRWGSKEEVKASCFQDCWEWLQLSLGELCLPSAREAVFTRSSDELGHQIQTHAPQIMQRVIIISLKNIFHSINSLSL